MPRYLFGDVWVDTDQVEVTGPDGVHDIEPQAFDVLCYFIDQPGRLVTKEELLDNVWGDRFVSESALTTRIKQVRRALGDDGRTQWAIRTVHGRGYRFIAEAANDPAAPTDDPAVSAGPGTAGQPVAPAPLPDELRADTRQMFVGRVDELAQANRVFDDVTDGSFRWIWLLGEPGIGKTRLAAQIAGEAQQRGHRVLFGRNNEDLRVPHQPFIEVIRAALDQVPADEREAWIASLAAPLAPLLPDVVIDADASQSASTDSGDTDTRRYLLFEAVANWLISAAASTPLTVIIDDAHWAAESTLQLLAHLQQRAEGAAVTFVITARDTAPDTNPRVTRLVSTAQGASHTAVVRLVGLTGEDAIRFVGESAPLDEVMAQTAGNPLLLQAVNQADGSVDVNDAVHRRLASLEPSVQQSLQVASVIGLEFELRVAASAEQRDELDLLDDLEQAVAARLLDDVGVDRFRFTHALVRSTLRNGLSSARRARLHRRTADAIETLFSDERRFRPALAFHTAEAAESDRTLRPTAVERLELAAEESATQLSYYEAARSLERALTFVDPDDTALTARLTLAKGVAETRAGASVTATRTFERAVATARALDDPLLRIEAALRYEDAAWRPGIGGTNAIAHLTEASDVLDQATAAGDLIDDEATLRAQLAIARLRALALAGNDTQAHAEFPSTHDLARSLGVPNVEASLLNVYLSQVRFFLGAETAHALVERLAELQPAIDDGDVALHAIHVRMLYASLVGEFAAVQDLADLMDQLQQRSGSTFWHFIRKNQEAMDAFYRGDLAETEHLSEVCLDLANELPEEDGSGTYGLRMFLIRREQDQLAQIAPLVRHVLSKGDITSVWTPGLALLLAETGSPDEAAESLRDIKNVGFDLPIDAMWSTVMVFLIETMVQLGDTESCAVLADRFAPMAGTNVVTGSGLVLFGRAERYLGMLAFARGNYDEAEQHLGVALEADAAGGSVLWANESRLWLSRTRRAQGHDIEADAMLAVVASQAEAAGLQRLVRLATQSQ